MSDARIRSISSGTIMVVFCYSEAKNEYVRQLASRGDNTSAVLFHFDQVGPTHIGFSWKHRLFFVLNDNPLCCTGTLI